MKRFIGFLLTSFIVFGITIIFNIDERKGVVYMNDSVENCVVFVSMKAGIAETIATTGYGRADQKPKPLKLWLPDIHKKRRRCWISTSLIKAPFLIKYSQ